MGTTNSKPPGPIVMIGQSKTGSSSQIIFITLFSSRCTALLRFKPASAKMQEQNHFPEPNRHMLNFLHPNSLSINIKSKGSFYAHYRPHACLCPEYQMHEMFKVAYCLLCLFFPYFLSTQSISFS